LSPLRENGAFAFKNSNHDSEKSGSLGPTTGQDLVQKLNLFLRGASMETAFEDRRPATETIG
jgi:hypothetical protein